MNDRLLRIGAVAAVTGAAAQLVASLLEPDWGGPPAQAVRVVATNAFWDADRVLDLIGVFLTVGALTVVGRTFAEGSGREWARLGQPFVLLMAALGGSAVATGATMKILADKWAGGATPREAYLAAFDAASRLTEVLFFAAFMALGVYLATLAAAIRVEQVYAGWLAWAAAVSAVLILCGDVLQLASDVFFVAVLAGFAIFVAVVAALGVSLWRLAVANERRPLVPRRHRREPVARSVTTEGP
jgi:hypothetical protein